MSKIVVPLGTPDGALPIALAIKVIEGKIFDAMSKALERSVQTTFEVGQWIERNELSSAMKALHHQDKIYDACMGVVNLLMFERSVLEKKLRSIMEEALAEDELENGAAKVDAEAVINKMKLH